MTNKEAKIIVSIMCRADGDCTYCAEELVKEFVQKFPNIKTQAFAIFEDYFGYKPEEE